MTVLRVENIVAHSGPGSLRGWCHVILPGGVRVRGVAVHRRPGRLYARMPRFRRIGPDGRQARHEPSGAAIYDQPIVFESLEDQKGFSDQVVDAVRAQCPKLLA